MKPRKPPKADDSVRSTPRQQQPTSVMIQERLLKLLSTVAIETWRMKRKLQRAQDTSGQVDVRGIQVSLDRMESGLREFGIECKDHTNQPYDGGMSLSVLAFEPSADPDARKDMITQTISPSVFIGGQLKRQGEVVVASAGEGRASSNGERDD
ncbi:MAG: hypothetical protein Q7N50_02425 [Armatimonadota bacterium]|nr:hypothetical protein [Armatimonadota bacterium]